MAKNKRLFWIDMALLALLAATFLSITAEVFTHSFIHVIFGLLLSGSALFHIILHWNWIKSAVWRINDLPDQARSNAWLNLALFGGYIVCGSMGLIARLMLIIPPLHVLLGWFHAVLAILVVTLQIVHIIRHWKWITAMAGKLVVA
jgi:hypothetical protein